MEAAPHDMAAFGYKQELKRSLGLPHLLAYGLVFIVPLAPVGVFGIVFNASHGMVPLVYLIGLLAMLFTALSYMAMSRAFPVAGSVYTYASRSLGPTAGFFAGWALLLDYLLIPTVTYVGCAIAVHAALPEISRSLSVVVMAVAATLVNYLGIETTARASFVLLAIQLVILALFALLGTHALIQHVAGARLSLAPFYNPAELTPRLVFSALSFAVFSFLGFDAISTLSEEAKGGAAAIGRATMLSLCLTALVFVAQTWLASLFVLGRTSLPAGNATNAAFYDIAALVGGYWFKFLLAVPGVWLSGMASAVAAQAATTRLLFGMARDGTFPRALAHVDRNRKVPLRAMFLVATITLVTGLLLVDRLELLVSMISFGALVGFLLLHVSAIVHVVSHQRNRNWLRHLVAACIGLAVVAYVLLRANTNAKITGTVWLAVGLATLGTLKLTHRLRKAASRSP
jgi:amino acid transporter